MTFEPKQLRGFVAVAEAGSIGMAAKAINITQPALSRIIRNLEDRHGVKLFERTSTGVVLSEAGAALMPSARMLLFEMESAADELRAFRGLRRGEVRVGAVSAVNRTILAPAVGKLREAAPHLRIKIVESHDDLLFAALVGNQIDLVISADTHQSDEVKTIAECRFEDAYSVFCRVGHPLAGEAVSLEQVLPGEWVMPPAQSTPRKLFEDIVRQRGLPRPEIVIETISTTAMIACATHTDVLGWLPTPVFQSAEIAGFVERLNIVELNLSRRFYLFRRAKGILSPATRAFVDALPLRN